MSLKPKAPTIGYHYKWAMHFAWCRFADTLHKIDAGAKIVWTGCIHETGQIVIAAPEAWGGEKAEGGVEGTMDVQFGLADQPANSYLAATFGEPQTGNRNVVTTVYRGGRYGAFVPNPKPMHMLWECIHAMWPGGEAWYPETAAIPLAGGGGGGYLLVTGSAPVPGEAMFVEAAAQAALSFVGIPQAAGADIQDGAPGYYDGAWVVVGDHDARLSTDNRQTWVSINNDRTAYRVTGGPEGWLTTGGGGPVGEYDHTGKASPIAAGFDSYAFVAEYPPGTTFRAHGEEAVMCRYTGGFYWIDVGALGELVKTATLGDPLQLVYKFPSNADAAAFLDIEVAGGYVYAVAAWNRITPRHQLRRSSDGGATFPDVLIDEATTSTYSPRWIQVGGDRIVVLSWDSTHMWTSDDGFTTPRPTGIGGDRPGTVYVTNARRLAYSAGRFFAVSGPNAGTPEIGNSCVATVDGITFGSPADTGVASLIGIAASPPIAPTCTINAMNPAHIIYDALTGEEMQGEPTGLIDEASFIAAADTLYAEGFGLCTTYDSDQESPWDFIQRICNVAGAACSQSRITGLYYLDLIRNDYDIDDLPIITDDDIIEWQEEATVPAEMVNSVAVTWYDVLNKEERTTAPIVALGHVRTSGEVIPQTSVYKEIPFEDIALRCAKRDVDGKSKPLRKFSLTVQRKHRFLRPSMPFRLQAPKRGIADMVCRLGQISHGVHLDGRVRMIAVQDIFGLPDAVHISPITPPTDSTDPTAADLSIAMEAPYVELAGSLSATDLAAVGEETGFLLTGVSAPTRGQRYAIYSALPAETLERRAYGDFAPHATTTAAVLPLDTEVGLATQSLPERIEVGDWARWEDEIIRVDGIAAGILTMGRGCADTVPAAHAGGSTILFMGAWGGTDAREYATGDVLAVKLPVNSGSAEQPLIDVDELEVTFAQRQVRPYPPGNLTLNGEPFYASGSIVVAPPWGGGGSGGGGGGGSGPGGGAPGEDRYLIYTPDSLPASRSVGPNGGFPDPQNFPYPPPAVFGSNVIPNGDFADAGDLAEWTLRDWTALPALTWTIDTGKLRYQGDPNADGGYRSTIAARNANFTMGAAPFPIYRAHVSAKARTLTPSTKAQVGVIVAGTGVGEFLSTPVEVSSEQTINFEMDMPFAALSGGVRLQYPSVRPIIKITTDEGTSAICTLDDASLEFEDIAPAFTEIFPTGIDLTGGDTDWDSWPVDPYAPTYAFSGGTLTVTVGDGYIPAKYFALKEAISSFDTPGQYIRIEAEVWSNDEIDSFHWTFGGVMLGLAKKTAAGYQVLSSGLWRRGDFTLSTAWLRLYAAPEVGETWHILIGLRGHAAKVAKVRAVRAFRSGVID
jgi:hypothetical protein